MIVLALLSACHLIAPECRELAGLAGPLGAPAPAEMHSDQVVPGRGCMGGVLRSPPAPFRSVCTSRDNMGGIEGAIYRFPASSRGAVDAWVAAHTTAAEPPDRVLCACVDGQRWAWHVRVGAAEVELTTVSDTSVCTTAP